MKFHYTMGTCASSSSSAAFVSVFKVLSLISCGSFLIDVLVLGNQCSLETTLTYHEVNNTVLSTGLTYWMKSTPLEGTHSLASCVFHTPNNGNFGFAYNVTSGLCTPVLGFAAPNTDDTEYVDDMQEKIYLRIKLKDCPHGFKLYGSDEIVSCVRLSEESLSYTRATSQCNEWGGHLVVVKTVVKLTLMRDYAADGVKVWTGLDDIDTEDVFVYKYDDSEMTIEQRETLFYPGHPNNGNGGNQDCVLIDNTDIDMLNDWKCEDRFRFLCEIYIY